MPKEDKTNQSVMKKDNPDNQSKPEEQTKKLINPTKAHAWVCFTLSEGEMNGQFNEEPELVIKEQNSPLPPTDNFEMMLDGGADHTKVIECYEIRDANSSWYS